MRTAMPDHTRRTTDHPPPDEDEVDEEEKPSETPSGKYSYPLLKRIPAHAPARTLAQWREELFFSQREFAEALRIHDTSLNRYELGIRNPRPRTLRQIAERLGVSPKQITLLGPKRSARTVRQSNITQAGEAPEEGT